MTTPTRTLYQSYIIEEYHFSEEPYYVPIADEVELFEAAYMQKIPVLFKGPTGCGKTRFVEYMSYKLGRPLTKVKGRKGASKASAESSNRSSLPLVTIACHEDLTASDLVGRYLLEGESTVWIDGPLTRAVKAGGHMLPGRDSRGQEGYNSADSPPDGPQAYPSGREAWRGFAGR